MIRRDDTRLFLTGIPNSYSQVFFSDNRVFAVILILITFFDVHTGLLGFLSVITTNLTGFFLGFDRRTISKGLFGFNSLLVGLGLGIYFEPGLLLVAVVILGAIMTLLIAVSMQGVIGKYALPFLSIPFLLSIWVMTLATGDFTALGISERGIYTYNDLYTLGGGKLVQIYEWWNSLQIPRSLRIYLISLGAILFQYNVLSGLILAAGLLYYSRISFTLSLVGFYTAYVFYEIIGADISELSYSYIGFNYILTSIALGGFFIIPSRRSYLWVLVLIPIVALVTISVSHVFLTFRLPVYSLPFNIVVLLFLYALKFRTRVSKTLSEVYIQQNSPERNLYSFHNDLIRFRHREKAPVKLPFFGTWTIMQAHNGEYTHKDEYRHAWDFVITDTEGKQYSGTGDNPGDYYCYDRQVLAPAGGTVEHVVDDIDDNRIGEVNIRNNWGNTVIIRHSDDLFTSMSHLKKDSVTVKPGERVKAGDIVARCGNSGRSPYPHLHFQFQRTPYIGSVTLDYPFSHYILHRENRFSLCSFDYPLLDEQVSNIESHELLEQALRFIPGKKMVFEYVRDGRNRREEWDILTDPYNHTYISCSGTRSRAYFTSDGNLLFFTFFQGDKKSLLYYFFLAAFKIQSGFYQDLEIRDRYPLNLLFRQPLLSVQDFLAPFWRFFDSVYRLRYAWIDNEISPKQIRLESSAANILYGQVLKRIDFAILIDEDGISRIEVKGKKLKIEAECTDYT